MFDQDEGEVLFHHSDEVQNFADLDIAQPGERLIQKKNARVQRQGQGDLQLPFVSVREFETLHVCLIANAYGPQGLLTGGHRFGLMDVLKKESSLRRVILVESNLGQDQVVQGRERFKDRNELKGPHQPHLHPVIRREHRDILTHEEDFAVARWEEAGQKIKERRFTGPVGSDDACDLSLFQLEVHIVDSCETIKSLREALCLNEDVA